MEYRHTHFYIFSKPYLGNEREADASNDQHLSICDDRREPSNFKPGEKAEMSTCVTHCITLCQMTGTTRLINATV